MRETLLQELYKEIDRLKKLKEKFLQHQTEKAKRGAQLIDIEIDYANTCIQKGDILDMLMCWESMVYIEN